MSEVRGKPGFAFSCAADSGREQPRTTRSRVHRELNAGFASQHPPSPIVARLASPKPDHWAITHHGSAASSTCHVLCHHNATMRNVAPNDRYQYQRHPGLPGLRSKRSFERSPAGRETRSLRSLSSVDTVPGDLDPVRKGIGALPVLVTGTGTAAPSIRVSTLRALEAPLRSTRMDSLRQLDDAVGAS